MHRIPMSSGNWRRRFSPQSRVSSSRKQRFRQLFVETLEARRLLVFGSCNTFGFAWDGSVTGTTVSITLTAADNELMASEWTLAGVKYLAVWNEPSMFGPPVGTVPQV